MKTATVLVVDDGDDIRRLVLELLRRDGIEGEEAASGIEALERLKRDPLPDLVVLDVQMPDLDGWDTLDRIRRDPRTADLAVVLCTVKAGDAAVGYELDCDGYVTKPFAIATLVDEIRAVLALDLEQRRERRRLLRKELRRTT